MDLEEVYESVCSERSDINEHLPMLRKYAEQSGRILELGTRYGTSTTALLAGQPQSLVSIDINPCENKTLKQLAGKTRLRFFQTDSRTWKESDYEWANSDDYSTLPQWVAKRSRFDTLFVDTDHTFEQVTAELEWHAPFINRWIILHDTVSFPPVLDAVREFLTQHPEWSVIEDHQNNNGLIVLERRTDERMD